MAEEIIFELDLVQQTISHLSFLKTVHELTELRRSAVLSNAVYRYERYWLPLAADHPDECLSAPLDIEWAWHCHMLAPKRYALDCEAKVNTLINHTVRCGEEYENALLTSEKYWREKYFSVEEPFQFDTVGRERSLKTAISFFLPCAMDRQRSFYYQVSLPHFHDKKFLVRALNRYKQFLYLKSKLPAKPVVPCFDIDLIWHTHQLHPRAYSTDTRAVLGYLFIHDDNVGSGHDKSSQLHTDTADTAKHWQETFQEPFALSGAMYRGPIPETRLFADSHNHFILMGVKVTGVSIKTVYLSAPRLVDWTNYENVRVLISRNLGESFTGQLSDSNLNPGEFQVVFDRPVDLDTRGSDKLELHIEVVRLGRVACIRHDTSLGKTLRRIDLLLRLKNIGDGQKFFDSCFLGNGAMVKLFGSFSTSLTEMTELNFHLEEGSVTQVNVVDINMHTFWGPFPLEVLWERDEKESCLVASHGMRYGGDTGFFLYKAKLVHLVSSGLFLVQILQDDHVVAAAHLIGPDQLPRPDQVEDDCITLDTDRSERAILIKSRSGDWGILTGFWKTCSDGLAESCGDSQKDCSTGDRGGVKMNFYKLSTGQKSACFLEDDSSYFRTASVELDLVHGKVKMDAANVLEMAETLALAFSACLMFMLCVPGSTPCGPSGSKHAESTDPLHQNTSEEDIALKKNENEERFRWDHWKFFRACALGQASLVNPCSSSVDLARVCAVCAGYHSYTRPQNRVIKSQTAISTRKTESESQREERQRNEGDERHIKHTAGMCLGCGSSGCRGGRY